MPKVMSLQNYNTIQLVDNQTILDQTTQTIIMQLQHQN